MFISVRIFATDKKIHAVMLGQRSEWTMKSEYYYVLTVQDTWMQILKYRVHQKHLMVF